MGNEVLGKRIEQRRKELGLTLDDIAQEIGVAKSTIQRYEKGTIGKIKLPVIEAIARVISVNPSWLCGKTNDSTPETISLPSEAIPIDLSAYHRIPILGRISAGLPLYADEHIEGYTLTDLNGGAEYFGLRVQGDSMNAMRINEGDIVIVRRQEEVEQGEVAVVIVDGDDATVKRFYSSDTIVTLMPQSTNPEHKPQIYDLSKTSIRVLGKVVKLEVFI